MINNNIKTNNKIPKDLNYQRELLPSPRCEGCGNNCIILYDSFHDQYFSEWCGLVVMEQGRFLVQYPTDIDFNE